MADNIHREWLMTNAGGNDSAEAEERAIGGNYFKRACIQRIVAIYSGQPIVCDPKK